MHKQVIIINDHLGMSAGKMAAQAAHASVGAVEKADQKTLAQWKEFGVTKIVLRAANEDRLIELVDQAFNKRLPFYLVADAGRTQIAPGSITALAIGPAPDNVIDAITGHLNLY